MKKILATAAIAFSLMACNSGSNSETNSDTSSATMNTRIDTSSINPGDSTGINRDTVRADRTRIKKNTDTSRRKY